MKRIRRLIQEKEEETRNLRVALLDEQEDVSGELVGKEFLLGLLPDMNVAVCSSERKFRAKRTACKKK